MPQQADRHLISEVARHDLGFASLRPGQEEAVTALLAGHDTLVVQPTGSGKSAIYQIAGRLIDGATLIISPLIALQKDQVDSIAAHNPADAVALNSTVGAAEYRENVDQIEQGNVEYIFLAPEQLRNNDAVERLKSTNISLFVVDEAHCISDWGHDFRPDYQRLGAVIESLGHPRVLALTATATAPVRDEIVERLGMRSPKVFVQGFDRPNIYLRVDRFKSESEKRDDLIHRTRWAEKPGIIYTGTRRAAEQIMASLAAEDIAALVYHGGLRPTERHEIQERFMSGDAEVIVATNAFGMGVDKSDVRFVYHYDVAESLDAYYQEIGRGGRDGNKTEAVLFYRHQDVGAQSFKTGGGNVDSELLEQLMSHFGQLKGSVRPEDMADELGIPKRKFIAALQRLEDAGAVRTLASGKVRKSAGADAEAAVRTIGELEEAHRETSRERLRKMREYAETSGCRREMLLRYLGDEYQGPCNNCDNCDASTGAPRVDPSVGTRREV